MNYNQMLEQMMSKLPDGRKVITFNQRIKDAVVSTQDVLRDTIEQ